MERTEIIKALEVHSTGSFDDCKNCPYDRIELADDETCADRMCHDALALIKELTEENERLTKAKYVYATVDYCSDDLAAALEENKRLTEENERLTVELDAMRGAANSYKMHYEKAKADTVREMQERFKELMGGEFASCGFCNAVGYWSVKAVKDNIDRISNEILNKNTEE